MFSDSNRRKIPKFKIQPRVMIHVTLFGDDQVIIPPTALSYTIPHYLSHYISQYLTLNWPLFPSSLYHSYYVCATCYTSMYKTPLTNLSSSPRPPTRQQSSITSWPLPCPGTSCPPCPALTRRRRAPARPSRMRTGWSWRLSLWRSGGPGPWSLGDRRTTGGDPGPVTRVESWGGGFF